MELINYDGIPVALIVNVKDFPNGMSFWTDDDSPLQFGSCVHPKGTVLQPHIHKERSRKRKHKTLEFLYVIKGAIRTTFYKLDRTRLCQRTLRAGDCVMLYDGGHGFKVLKEGTVFFEVKNGPYAGIEADKDKFDDTTV